MATIVQYQMARKVDMDKVGSSYNTHMLFNRLPLQKVSGLGYLTHTHTNIIGSTSRCINSNLAKMSASTGRYKKLAIISILISEDSFSLLGMPLYMHAAQYKLKEVYHVTF